MESILREEKEFPDDLESRIDVITNAINTGLKTVTLLHLDDRSVEVSEIRKRVRETKERGYLPLPTSFLGYCNTLHDISLVARETIIRRTDETNYFGYSLTGAGKLYGLPIAAFTLKYAVDDNLSMFSVLGSTQSQGKTRAPINRVRILEKLYEKSLREKDIKDKLTLCPGFTSTHLASLQKIGFVKYDSIGPIRKRKCKYKWKSKKEIKEVKPVEDFNNLTYTVAEYLYSHPNDRFDYLSLASLLKCESPSMISKILCGLERQRVAERENWGGRVFSEASILDKGREFVDSWLNPVKDALSNGDSLSEMKTILGEFRADPELFSNYVSRKIELYKKVSLHINRRSREERVTEIKEVLQKNPGITLREIVVKIGGSQRAVWDYLRIIPKIKTEKRELERRYFLEE